MKKILAVDDEEDILYSLKALSDEADFELEAVSDQKIALKKIREEDISMAIVDYYMPGIDGVELVKRIRKIDEDIPILVLTVDESFETAEEFKKAGADDFANKPIRAPDLISRINLHLKKKERGDVKEIISRASLPKGMSRQTLDIILSYLEDFEEFKTINEISEGTGLAYKTVHNYLNYLEKKGFVEVEYIYGKRGRPVHKYKLKEN